MRINKVLIVFGTRPEAIKMAPLVKEFQKRKERFETWVCITGQHREMLDQVLRIFGITPDFNLNIMKQGQDLYDITCRILLGMKDILQQVNPDLVLVHGDTTTSTAAALAAFYQQIPVGHIEAGLRTHNIYSPFPEEINRQITGRIATWHFSPTPLGRQNLLRENIAPDTIFVTGNTVIDALLQMVNKIKSNDHLQTELRAEILEKGYDTERLDGKRRLVLITGHRRENFGEGFIRICHAIKKLSETYLDVDFVYPVHLNPNVRKPIKDIFGETALSPRRSVVLSQSHSTLNANYSVKQAVDSIEHKMSAVKSNLFFIEPLDYLPFVWLMEKSYFVLTDSGGIQEEAPGLGKPVLVMRNTTERPEAVEAGTVALVGTDFDRIVSLSSKLLSQNAFYRQMSHSVNPYGDGQSCIKIVDYIDRL